MKIPFPALAAVAAGGYFYAVYRSGRSGLHPLSKPKAGQVRVACVGDSITYGHGTTSWPKHTYPAVLHKLLGPGYHVNNYGFNGKSVNPDCPDAYCVTKLFTQSLEYDADIVVFMMGTNDAKPRNWRGEEAFRADLEALLECYHRAEIILCTPAAAFMKDGVTGDLAEYEIQPAKVEAAARVIRQVAQERGCTLVDIHTLTADKPYCYICDRIHPGNTGAEMIAQAVAAAVQRRETK